MKAVILAAGYATRLYPLTKDKPKCLLTVGGKTLLDSLCEKLEKIEAIDEIIIVTNARFHRLLKDWAKRASRRRPIDILNDGTVSNETRLGAIGDFGLALEIKKIQSDTLLLAGDNLFDQDLKAFAQFAGANRQAISIGVYDIGDPSKAAKKFGVIEIEKSGKVASIEEKPEHPQSSLIGMGVYFFPKHTLPLVTEYLHGPRAQDAPGHYIRWLFEKGALIFAFVFSGMWYDIGDLKALEEANAHFKQ